MNKLHTRDRFIVSAVLAAMAIVALSALPSASAATAPTITSINPNSGPGVGGTDITITGTGFAPTASVKIGSSLASSTVVSSTTLLATTPAGAGPEDVVVSNGDGTFATSTNGFTYPGLPPTLTSIAITTPANKLVYHVGDALDLTGLVVTGTFSNGSTSTIPITTANVSGFNSTVPVNGQILTITSGLSTTTYAIDILPTALSIATSPNPDGSVSGTFTGTTTASTTQNSVLVSLEIPAGTVVTATSSWDGAFTLPVATSTYALTPSSGKTASAIAAIEIGAGDTALSLSGPAKITFTGQAGKLAGWSRAGVFTPITSTCDSTSSVPTLATGTSTGATDCKADVGPDLVVWTTHLTTFIAYSESATPSPSPTPSPTPAPSGGNGAPIGLIGYFSPTSNPAPTPTPSPTPTPPTGQVLGASTFNFTARLAFGSRGEAVTALQNVLTQQNIYSGPITGFFGRLTEAAVKAFQSAHGISAIGIVGPQTRAALNGLGGNGISASNQQLIAQLMQQVQALLARIAAMQAASSSTSTTASTTSATSTTSTATTTAATSTAMTTSTSTATSTTTH